MYNSNTRYALFYVYNCVIPPMERGKQLKLGVFCFYEVHLPRFFHMSPILRTSLILA